MIEFTVDINPMGAVRMTQRSKYKNEAASRYLTFKRVVGYEAMKHVKQPIEKPIIAAIYFYHPIPASWSKKKQREAKEGKVLPAVKPDLDNCVKAIFDSLNKVVWKDDNQVVGLTTRKYYSDNPKIVIRIGEVE